MQDSLEQIWKYTLNELNKTQPQTIMNLWFSNLQLCRLTDQIAVLICDTRYKYAFIKKKFLGVIADALAAVIGFTVEVIVVSREIDPVEYSAYVPLEGDAPEARNLAEMMPVRENKPEQFEDVEPSYLATDESAPKSAPAARPSGEGQNYPKEYTFENFIVGNSNKFAHAASIAVANEPACSYNKDSSAYNPLFIWGPSGLGKTHLLYAIINQIMQTRPELKIVYVKGEEFTNQMIDSLAKKTPEQFRNKYRKADILLIDDVQFIAGRDSTQEEFFHTFNALYEDHRQVILTSDRPPRDIKTLEDRLKTRFEWGIIADIQPPDADLRAAILRNKAAAMNLNLSNDVVDYVAENLKSNIRQVEGAIKKLAALTMLTGTPITVDSAREALNDMIVNKESVGVTIDRIFEKVAKKYGITPDDIKSPKRTKDIAHARHVAIYIIRKQTNLSLPQIGKLFKRDHTTVLSSLKFIEKEISTNSVLEMEITELIKEISD